MLACGPNHTETSTLEVEALLPASCVNWLASSIHSVVHTAGAVCLSVCPSVCLFVLFDYRPHTT
eukprot:COSAG06_NODE_6582_length_2870_cov_1.899314_1_plen_63_part_10